jgi:hypothetical protein
LPPAAGSRDGFAGSLIEASPLCLKVRQNRPPRRIDRFTEIRCADALDL